MAKTGIVRKKHIDYVGLVDIASTKTVAAAAGQGKALSRLLAPIDTGILRENIDLLPLLKNKSGWESKAPYSVYQEGLKSYPGPKQPFMRPGALKVAKLIGKIAKMIFRRTYRNG